MILAGIDEAGYGPVLGPLVVGCCAFHIKDRGGEEVPCLWTRLKRSVSKRKTAGAKLHVNDSKAVYTPATGLKDLERGILALAAAVHGNPADLDALLERTSPQAVADLAGYPWYRARTQEKFPLAQSAATIAVSANALGMDMRQGNVACVHLAARVLCEKQLNAMMTATRNKASALFSITAVHLDHLLRAYGEQELTIFCDRQGGRWRYGSLLRLMFEEWALEVTEETEPRSEYRLSRNGRSVRLIFCEKAEAQCLPVAAASMLCKYLREALMARFNAYWLHHVPLAEPTAGYYTDGLRFLRDIEPKRRELGIADGELIRCR
jgi:hypothetical protein